MMREAVQKKFDDAMWELQSEVERPGWHGGTRRSVNEALAVAANWATILSALPEPVSMVQGVPDYEFAIFGDGTNGGLVKDLCYTVFNIAKSSAFEDCGETDWMNDTLPKVDAVLKDLRALTNDLIDAAIKDGYRVRI